MTKGRLIHAESKSAFEISVPFNTGNGDHYVSCPICHESRKQKNQKEKEVGINQSKRTARCNHCGVGFKFVYEHEYKSNKEKPQQIKLGNSDLQPLSVRLVNYFIDKRGISIETLQQNYIKEAVKKIRIKDTGEYEERLCIAFVFYHGSELKAIKYRDKRKNFALETGSELIFYGINDIAEPNEIIIVEGETDKLSFWEIGIGNVVSVPNGVTISHSELQHYKDTGRLEITSAINMDYFDKEADLILSKDLVYIVTDNDAAGLKLKMELIRRIGAEKCKIIDYGKFDNPMTSKPCKDANEVLVSLGPEKLRECLRDASELPLDDVVRLGEVQEDLDYQYRHGLEKGITAGFLSLDCHFTWKMGYTIAINGHMGMGKTSFVLSLIVLGAINYGYKWGIYCPENYPVTNVYRMLVEIYSGKTMDIKSTDKINLVHYNRACEFVNKHFMLISGKDTEKGYSPEDLRKIASQMIKRYGINGFLTDPWNSLNHNYGTKSLDSYLEQELSAEVRFTVQNNIIKIINVHPPTPIRQKDTVYRHPTRYEIRGGNIWANKVYAMLCVDIPPDQKIEETVTEVYIQKVKDHKLVGIPTGEYNPVLFEYQRKTGRYYQKDGFNPFDKKKLPEQETLAFEEI